MSCKPTVFTQLLPGDWSEVTVHWQVCTQAGHKHSVSSIAFSPDGTRVVTGSRDKTVKIWDARTGAEVSGFSGAL